MKPPSELETYLRDVSDDGQLVDTEQSFSISKEKALEKLAAFQLPFDGAWALKLVQCAVASKICRSLVIQLEAKESLFFFEDIPSWSLEELESVLLDPEFSEDPALSHLAIGLRVVGLNLKQPFWVALKSESEALVWDGHTFSRVPKSQNAQAASLTLNISNAPITEARGIFGLASIGKNSARNAQLTKVLTSHAYACSIPLTLDGRRLDALEFDPRHGWTANSQVILIGSRDNGLPKIGMPPATGATLVPQHVEMEEKLKIASEELRKVREAQRECSLAFLLCAHLKREKSGKSYVWRDSCDTSVCNWVTDGVVILREELGTSESFCSVGCFVSTAGLKTDLSGFSLVWSDEKEKRLSTVKHLLADGLNDTRDLDFEKMRETMRKTHRTGSVVCMVFGVFLTVANPIVGLGVAGLGLAGLFTGGDEGEAQQLKVQESVRVLKQELREATHHQSQFSGS